MIREHYAAVKALLPADLTVYMGNVPETPTYPYVVLWGDQGRADTEALSDDPTDLTLRIHATVAGMSFDSVAIVIDRVRSALNRKKPAVAGRYVGPLVQSPVMGIQTDFTVNIPGEGHPLYAVDQYALQSAPG